MSKITAKQMKDRDDKEPGGRLLPYKYSISEAANYLLVSPQTVRRAIKGVYGHVALLSNEDVRVMCCIWNCPPLSSSKVR